MHALLWSMQAAAHAATPARWPLADPINPSPLQWQELAEWNARYEARFGHIFIVCASGKSAEEMLAIIKSR